MVHTDRTLEWGGGGHESDEAEEDYIEEEWEEDEPVPRSAAQVPSPAAVSLQASRFHTKLLDSTPSF
jgi:hypothetical protein